MNMGVMDGILSRLQAGETIDVLAEDSYTGTESVRKAIQRLKKKGHDIERVAVGKFRLASMAPTTVPSGPAPREGKHACPDCDRVYDFPQHLSQHRHRVHGVPPAKGKKDATTRSGTRIDAMLQWMKDGNEVTTSNNQFFAMDSTTRGAIQRLQARGEPIVKIRPGVYGYDTSSSWGQRDPEGKVKALRAALDEEHAANLRLPELGAMVRVSFLAMDEDGQVTLGLRNGSRAWAVRVEGVTE